MNMQIYKSYRKPLADTYYGKAQTATFTFSLGPEQLDSVNKWFVNQYVNECEKAISRNSPGDHVLTITLFRDTSPTWQTDYQCTIVSSDITGNPLPWLAILALVAIALVIVWLVVRPVLQSVTDLLYGKDGDKGAGGMGILPIALVVVGAIVLLKFGPSKKR